MLGKLLPLVLIAALSPSLLLLRSAARARRPARADVRLDVPNIPADVARPLSFGFRSLGADLLLLQAIQIHGGRREQTAAGGAADDRAMAALLDYATDLDPQFDGAYRFAGSALMRHTSDGKAVNVFAAVRILQKGVRQRPDDWRIPFFLGFIQSYYLGRSDEAAASMRLAAATGKAPPWLGLFATRLAADAGRLDMARQMANEMVAQAADESVRAEWEGRLGELDMEEHLRALEAAVQRYRAGRGKPPSSLDELVRAGLLSGIPREPHGGRYELGPDGVRSTAAPRLKLRGRADRSGLEIR